jgi:hypothetical protein
MMRYDTSEKFRGAPRFARTLFDDRSVLRETRVLLNDGQALEHSEKERKKKANENKSNA